MLTLLLTAPALAIGSPEAAPQPADQDIVVTGRGLRLDERDSDAETTIDRGRIEATASGRLEDALADIAGLQSFRRADSRSANPTAQGITLRGLGGNAASRALLILDGVPQADPFGGWIAFPAYASDRIGAIRVTRGGGSGTWGSGAIGGVIEMESAAPDQLSSLTTDIAYGERNAVDASASALLRGGTGFATLSAAYARGDGFIPIVEDQRGPVDRAAPFEQANVALRGVIAVVPSVELQSTVQAFIDRRDRGLDFTAIGSDGADASLRLVGRGAWRWSALAYLQTRRFSSQFASVNDARTTVTQTLDQANTPATGLGGRIEILPPLGDAVTLALGADVRSIDGETQELFTYVAGSPTRRRVAGGRTQTLGGFVTLGARLGPVRIEGDARIDGWWIENGRLTERTLGTTGPALTDTRFADRSGTQTTGRIGLAWLPVEAVTLRTAAYRAWRLPTPNELYRPFRAGADATAANALLDPEVLEGVEAGIDLRPAAGVTLSATAFSNRLDNAIANVTVARGPGNFPGVGFVSAAGFYRRRDNLDAIESRGVEVDASARFGAFGARLSYAYVDAEVRGADLSAPLDGLAPAQVPPHQFSGTISWQRGGAMISTTLRHVAAAFEDDQNSRSLDAATTVDAVVDVPLLPSLSLRLRGENLFDALVPTGFSGAALERARPRQLWAGFTARL
ncbi:TonB-dependent receptor [Sphingomonas sp. BGYR3]|uniref:TonB-dependent receptor n=1 Tax=Sphingomonas sp. BGYR3 TaxID=2975483 RepID=UPI0021A44F08|nr:TonB-dependent receptor [Sphingomonas sp. BGYR3]MDG5487622.1 TonB-dependent receptor [Sphingomonas sp. BGYR3]